MKWSGDDQAEQSGAKSFFAYKGQEESTKCNPLFFRVKNKAQFSGKKILINL